jgi:3-methyladenine DNA glycosylase/8-oxoguanine DNA glycosylase
MKLEKIRSLLIDPTSPFNFDATFYKPDHFTSGDNQWEPGVRWQTWRWEGGAWGLKFENRGTPDQPSVLMEIYGRRGLAGERLKSLVGEVRYRWNLDLDLSGFYEKFSRDKLVGPAIKRLRGMRPGHPSSLYEYLVIGVVLQNATVKRSSQMFKNLLEKYGRLLEYDGKKLWCFWAPGDLREVSDEELRALKVGYRAKAIKRIDEQFGSGLIDERDLRGKDMETQREELLKLYGVGPATVWYLLFDVFHHWDFFDHVSPWEQKIYSKLFFDRDPENPVPVETIMKGFDKYGDYKQLAVNYVWEDLWWRWKEEGVPWLEKLIRA